MTETNQATDANQVTETTQVTPPTAPVTTPVTNGATPQGGTLLEVKDLKMYFPITSGVLFQRHVADVKAVGPDVWNPWKASLIGELYVKALSVLEEAEKGEFERPDVRAAIRRVQTRVRRQLAKDYPEDKIDKFLEVMPERYFLSTPEVDIPGHFDLMERWGDNAAEVSIEHFPERDCTSVVICAQDRPGLFASITGVLTALQLDILNARIFTGSDGRTVELQLCAEAGPQEDGHRRRRQQQRGARSAPRCDESSA